MRRIWVLLTVIITLGMVVGCRPKPPAAPASDAPGAGQPQPAPTEAPAAMRVNGETISLAVFENRVSQFQQVKVSALNGAQAQVSGAELAQIKQQVLDGFVEQVIISQEAEKRGLIVSEMETDRAIADMKQSQTEAGFAEWLKLNNFTEADLQQTLRAQMVAAAVFEAVSAEAPTTAEQVHVRHILVADPAVAQDVLTQLQNGASFAELAQQYSQDAATRQNSGDLGWFPRNVQVLPPSVEAVAFSLAAGETSSVLNSDMGYHIIKVERREMNHPLTPEYRRILQNIAFNEWLAQKRAAAQVEWFIN